MKKLVIALGGNALGKSAEEQRQIVQSTAVPLVDLIAAGYEIVLSHGNGPQVGMINLAFEKAGVKMPFPECGAMSQGYIGYHLQNAIHNELHKRGLQRGVVSLITQVRVDPQDPAFQHPSKPIGGFFTEAEARERQAAHPDRTYTEDAGRGWRRVVASPQPLDIVEIDMIRSLIHDKYIVIAGGGGGIPVEAEDGHLYGHAAVIDKDFESALLAQLVGADTLVILTAVEKVAIRFGQADQQGLDDVSVAELEVYREEGHFARGSMLPKVEAAIRFVKGHPERSALITSLEKALDGLAGKTGTHIHA